jgi:LDH2 family malate/lactate/ureidoglycolate dehydrogenase
MDLAEFTTRIQAYAEAVRAARPLNPDDQVRMPFDRSAQIRTQIVARGTIEVADTIIDQLQTIVQNG